MKHPEATRQHIPCIARNVRSLSPYSLLVVVATTGERSKAHREPAACWWLAFLFFLLKVKKCALLSVTVLSPLYILYAPKTKVQETNTSQTCVLVGDVKRTRSSVLEPPSCLDGPRTSKCIQKPTFRGAETVLSRNRTIARSSSFTVARAGCCSLAFCVVH